jgi:RNA polymerase sigma factor (sigma-70 family)
MQVHRLFGAGTSAGLDEAELLSRFVDRGDPGAFEAIVARHGPMVLRICRQLLSSPDAVDDAFQATFLVLVRKAGSIRDGHRLGSWLYGVAYRVAGRLRAHEPRQAVLDVDRAEAPASCRLERAELFAALHEEVSRLPEKYRAPIVLCYMEGMSHLEAARQLRWPVGTVRGRMARGRVLLRTRLTRRGLDPSPGGEALALLGGMPHRLPGPLFDATALLAAAAVRSAPLSTRVLTLTEGVVRAMFWEKTRRTTAVVFATGILAVGGFSQNRAGHRVAAASDPRLAQAKGAAPIDVASNGPAKAADPASHEAASQAALDQAQSGLDLLELDVEAEKEEIKQLRQMLTARILGREDDARVHRTLSDRERLQLAKEWEEQTAALNRRLQETRKQYFQDSARLASEKRALARRRALIAVAQKQSAPQDQPQAVGSVQDPKLLNSIAKLRIQIELIRIEAEAHRRQFASAFQGLYTPPEIAAGAVEGSKERRQERNLLQKLLADHASNEREQFTTRMEQVYRDEASLADLERAAGMSTQVPAAVASSLSARLDEIERKLDRLIDRLDTSPDQSR